MSISSSSCGPLPTTHADIDCLIPHSGSMCLLDRVVFCDQQTICCESNSHLDLANPLRNAQGLPVTAALEYAAQAAAVHGALTATDAGLVPKGGYLAVLSNVRWYRAWLHDQQTPLVIEVNQEARSSTGMDCGFLVRTGDLLLAEGSMLVAFIQNSETPAGRNP